MPVHVQLNPLAQFVVTLWRDGDVVDSQVARDGERAAYIAVVMLAHLGPLKGGDRLDVVEG